MARSSFANDITQEQLQRLNALRLNAFEQTLSSSSESDTSLEASAQAEQRVTQLRHALNRLDTAKSLSRDKLLQYIQDDALDAHDAADRDEAVMRSFYLSQVVTNLEGICSDALLREAEALSSEYEYWSSLDGSLVNTALYLLQTLPLRLYALAHVVIDGVAQAGKAAAQDASMRSVRARIKTVLSTTPNSVFFGAMFPHIDHTGRGKHASTSVSSNLKALQRRATLLGLSPVSLTRQEVSGKRKAARDALNDRLRLLGRFAIDRKSHGTISDLASRELPDPETNWSAELPSAVHSTLEQIDRVMSSQGSSSQHSNTQAISNAAELVRALLKNVLPEHERRFQGDLAQLKRPSRLTRAWPAIVSAPIIATYISRTVYNSRDSIAQAYKVAKETVRGFVVDWVIEPVRKILETFRHSDQSLALMGRESLNSDLASLERMTIDFARDTHSMSPAELDALSDKVRAGDLTVVLKAWENDIKSPLKSTVTGTLIRTLLIQIQKVKVDVDLATSGIEKMLRSQQLTFAFVGVAPSMLILFVVGRWARNTVRGEGASKKKGRAVRRKYWSLMRTIDSCVSTTDIHSTDDASLRLGSVLLSLDALRKYASSRAFPVKDAQLKSDFLQDVRALEKAVIDSIDEEGDKVSVNAQRKLDRLWKWADALGWMRLQ